MRRLLSLVAGCLVLVSGLGVRPVVAQSEAQPQTVVRAVLLMYVPREVEIGPGGSIVLESYDVEPHTITARDKGPDGRPLFDSSYNGVGLLGREAVGGVSELAPGRYEFYCRFHSLMAGVLRVRA